MIHKRMTLASFIWHFLKPYKPYVALFILLSMMTGIWGPLNSYLTKHIIDSLSASEFSHIKSVVFWPSIFFIINFELFSLYWRGINFINYKFQQDIKNNIIIYALNYVLMHSHQFFQDNLAGKIASQINILADNIERIVHDSSRILISSFILLTLSFISMFLVNPKFFYVLFIWFIIFTSISLLLSRRLIKLSESYAESETLVSGHLVDSVSNANNVRIFARRIYEVSYIGKILLLTKKAFQAKELFEIKLNFFQGLCLSSMIGFMLYYLIDLRSQNLVTIGDFTLILGLSFEVGYMIWWSIETIDEINKSIGKCKQSLTMLFIPIDIKDQKHASSLICHEGRITFDHVTFHYKNDFPFINDLSVSIEPGQKVGLVGYSGSGKSTFVNLILRFYEIQEGKILIDNQNIYQVTQDSLRAHIAIIPQDPSLFHRSLMDNIRYGCINASDAEVIEAAKKAHAHDFIIKLPQGYETLVGERGIKLSGGQRQRVAIARAILKNAPILILDEATSQLDSVTENEIQVSIEKFMKNKTALIVAHRLSTLLKMDRILVFDNGKIVEDGSHPYLLNLNGLYKKLWNAQIGGFLPHKKDENHTED